MFVSMWHVEAANIKVFSVLQLQFGPQYLAVCGQFRLFNRDSTENGAMDPTHCAVCMERYSDPKFLLCYHTFCASCIQGVADSNQGGEFPCPFCRKMTSLPPGGVASLCANLYIRNEQPPEKLDNPNTCEIHSGQKMEFWCGRCDEVLCLTCKCREHKGHPTVGLTPAVSCRKSQLQEMEGMLQRAFSVFTDKEMSLKEEKRAVTKKMAAVEANILARHAVIVAAADAKRDEELRTLASQHAVMTTDIDEQLEVQKGNREELSTLLSKLRETLDSGTDREVFALGKKLTREGGDHRAREALLQSERPTPCLIQRPVLQFDVSSAKVVQTIEGYLGTVRQMEMKKRKPEVNVTKSFRCASDFDAEVYSMCHNDGEVVASYEWCGMKKNAHVRVFTEWGRLLGFRSLTGKVTCRILENGIHMFTGGATSPLRTFSKSPTAANYSLDRGVTGEAEITKYTSTLPFRPMFKIQVGTYRVFDVDDSEKYFAVVEEAEEENLRRKVRLFQRGEDMAVCTYEPPVEGFQPSDLCFYTLRGKKVLLITDEASDSVHVVTIMGRGLLFERYLCEGCPSLIQPTAITVDPQSRLWLACRGGGVLVMEQI
ncbi:hypothetical protein ACOMHN_004627 [Nucella lapillus]